jgi:hypothetical protein
LDFMKKFFSFTDQTSLPATVDSNDEIFFREFNGGRTF